MNQGLVLLVAPLLLAAAMFGQALTSLTGTVVDPSGAMVPGASITIQNTATHATRETVSDGSGRYSLLQVQPGTYTVTAKAPGLADVMVNRVELLVSTPATLTIAFEKIGTVNEVVSVSAETVCFIIIKAREHDRCVAGQRHQRESHHPVAV